MEANCAEYFTAATIGGADALGRPDLGRLTPGALADLVVWDLAGPHLGPAPRSDPAAGAQRQSPRCAHGRRRRAYRGRKRLDSGSRSERMGSPGTPAVRNRHGIGGRAVGGTPTPGRTLSADLPVARLRDALNRIAARQRHAATEDLPHTPGADLLKCTASLHLQSATAENSDPISGYLFSRYRRRWPTLELSAAHCFQCGTIGAFARTNYPVRRRRSRSHRVATDFDRHDGNEVNLEWFVQTLGNTGKGVSTPGALERLRISRRRRCRRTLGRRGRSGQPVARNAAMDGAHAVGIANGVAAGIAHGRR